MLLLVDRLLMKSIRDMNKALFTSLSNEWETPQELFDLLSDIFGGFDLDVCANENNAKVDRYFSPDDDGLSRDWTGKCWMNPPYGREIGKWVRKARGEYKKHHSLVVCLVPARTDTRWFQDNVVDATMIVFIRGRLGFTLNGGEGRAPFPSCLVIFGPVDKGQGELLAGLGLISILLRGRAHDKAICLENQDVVGREKNEIHVTN